MYYIKVKHHIPCDVITWEELLYFKDKTSAAAYVEDYFNPMYYDADCCYITETGEATWDSVGQLVPM